MAIAWMTRRRPLARAAVTSDSACPATAAAPDFWRAPVDNDVVMAFDDPVADSWREAGLDRLGRKTVAVRAGDG
jgi:Beta galactosidase small chain